MTADQVRTGAARTASRAITLCVVKASPAALAHQSRRTIRVTTTIRGGTAVLGCAGMVNGEPLVRGSAVARLRNAEVAARTGDGRAVRPWI